MRFFSVIAATVGIVSLGGCSSSTDSGNYPAQDAGGSLDSGIEGVDGAADAAVDAPDVVLQAPFITMLMQMTGGLHVMWTNKQTDCDSIEGERKSAVDAYKVVFTVPDGTVNNKHDAPLSAGTSYTYRLRCKKGSSYSPYSNEKSGTP